jgi:hypothetical protein
MNEMENKEASNAHRTAAKGKRSFGENEGRLHADI